MLDAAADLGGFARVRVVADVDARKADAARWQRQARELHVETCANATDGKHCTPQPYRRIIAQRTWKEGLGKIDPGTSCPVCPVACSNLCSDGAKGHVQVNVIAAEICGAIEAGLWDCVGT